MRPRVSLTMLLTIGLVAGGCRRDSSGNGSGPPTPTVSLTASPASGDSAVLSWSSTDATDCSASGAWSGPRPVSGTESVGPIEGVAGFSLSCSGPGGVASASVEVAVGAAPAPDISFSATPTTVTLGVASTLSWTSSNASSCEASGAWTGARPPSGSASTGAITADSTYTIRCTGLGGSASRTIMILVDGSAQPPTVTLSTNPSSTPTGGSVVLSWTSTDTALCTASEGWSGEKPPSGTESTGSLSETTTFALDCVGPGGGARDTVIVEVREVESPAVFPLTTAPDQHHLIDSDGQPFLINGDTAWSLMVALTDSEVTQYLDDRHEREFDTILVNLIEHRFAPDPPRNVYGVAPFTTSEDIRTPNDVYFDRCVDIVQQALDRDMLVMMTPAYLGIAGGDEGWWQALSARTTSEVQAYGAYVGSKFAAFPNLVWVMGGDYFAPEVLSRTRALVTGLKSTGRADWLFTYHAGPNFSSSDVVGDESWLDINATYGYEDPGLLVQFESDYGRTPTRPFFLFESRYEQGSPAVSTITLRSQAYWAVLTGGMGALFGNSPIWKFDNNGPYGPWQSSLNTDGAHDRTRFRDFFSTYDWSSLVPDRSGTVLTGGQGSGEDGAYAAKSNDSTLVIVYTPIQKQLTIDMSELGGPSLLARWFKPDSATYTTIDSFPNTGSRDFTPPASGDWVLVLQSAQ